MGEELRIRIHGDASRPTLIYLPGIHGDWTLVTSFRHKLGDRVRFVEFTYPRTLTWSLDDYAQAIEECLIENGITSGWLLGESFGSQIVWPLAARNPPAAKSQSRLKIEGIILAAGFARHPLIWGVRMASRMTRGVSMTWLTRFLFFYAKYARFRHRRAPETLDSIREFISRRTELDRQAAVHRLNLIAANNPVALFRQLDIPVYYLAGLFDPIVQWPWVRWWLRRNCPGYRGGKMIWRADHNVLGTAPKTAADIVMAWIHQQTASTDGKTSSAETGPVSKP